MSNFSNMANLIKKYRASKYSQSNLSRLLGYRNGQFISNVERGLCGMPLKHSKQLIELLAIPEEEFKQDLMDDYKAKVDSFFQNSIVEV